MWHILLILYYIILYYYLIVRHSYEIIRMTQCNDMIPLMPLRIILEQITLNRLLSSIVWPGLLLTINIS